MPDKNGLLRVGVIGLGMGMGHLVSYKDNPKAVVEALSDSDEGWLRYVAKEYSVNKTYTNYMGLLSDNEIDAVSICLPTALHAEATIAALESGKHVLCEKPMATSLKEANAMEETAQKTGKLLMISHQQRFGSDIQLLKRHVDEGTFGDIYAMRIVWRRPHGMLPTPHTVRLNGGFYSRNWFNEKNNGGGVLRDLGTHMIDLAMYLTGFPTLLSASGSLYRQFYPQGFDRNEYTFDSEDTAIGFVKFKSGLSVSLEVNFASYTDKEVIALEIFGSKGGATRINSEVKIYTNVLGADVELCTIRDDTCVKSSQEHFIDAIIQGGPVPIPGSEGVEVIRILDEIYRDAKF